MSDLPGRIILSRKGFDGGTGCAPSPIFDDETMFSLPIPDADGTVSYGDLVLGGHHYHQLITDLKAKRRDGGKKPVPLAASDHAHLDPDLIAELRPRKPGWRPAFGQCGKDATILRRHGVGPGDLFLFFGWFRRCSLTGQGYHLVRGEPDLHVMFGYLRIGKVLRLDTDPVPGWAQDHPHFHGTARKMETGNTLYLAADALGLPGAEDLPSAAAFRHFTPSLQLTAPDMSRSHWRLPAWFHPGSGASPLSSHADPARWDPGEDCCYLHSVPRGQEFILEAAHYPEAVLWAAALIRGGHPVYP